jgi:prephenate dehydrogenase
MNAPEIQRLTAGSFSDATRVAASSPELWADIFTFNRDAVIEAIMLYREELDGFLKELTDSDSESLEKRFAAGSEAKRSWNQLT